jgi:hypothetical protein
VADQAVGKLEIERSLLDRAKRDDNEAVELMFRQFVPADETVLAAEYMGVQGMWWVGRHSFALLTNRRIASLWVGPWGEVIFQDGLLENHNSGIVYQPRILGLYILCIVYSLFALAFTLGLGLVLLPYLVQSYYRVNKCGLVWCIKEGVSVYLFTNRNRLTKANALYRAASMQHDRRLAELPMGSLSTV